MLNKSKYLQESQRRNIPIEEIAPISVQKYKKLVKKLEEQPKLEPFTSGMPCLDQIIGGFEAGRLYVLSAPTKNGKTTLAQTLMYNMSKQGIASLFFSYEMGWQEVVQKYIDMDKATNPKAPTDLPMYLPTDLHRGGGDLQMQWLYEIVERAKKKRNIKFFVIDHLHFLLPLKDYKNLSIIIGGIVRELKKIAVNLNVAIMLISHIRKVENDKVPTYLDIRDSSLITQEADVVLMMYRLKDKEAAMKITDANTKEPYLNEAILSVELNRMTGKTSKAHLIHTGVMFREITEKEKEDKKLREFAAAAHRGYYENELKRKYANNK